jgi:hypothetical protein
MNHLSRDEFVDVIESSRTVPPERLRHLEACRECRAQAEALRAVRLMATEDEAAEPSPLFWDHFAARVAEQVRGEPVPVAPARWLPGSFATWAVAGTVAVLLITTALWRTTLHAPAPAAAPIQAAVAPAVQSVEDVEPVDDLETDEAWAVVREATADLSWEDADRAGIAAHPGDVENAALQLNAAERVELARLLNADLKRNGA